MKKFLYIGMVLVIAISLSACGSKAANNATTKTTTKAATSGNITYTKELKYVPAYTSDKATSFTAATKKHPFATARYIIKNTTDSKVYSDYENLLGKDGWTIGQAKRNISFQAKKGSHIADVLIINAGKGIMLVIISK